MAAAQTTLDASRPTPASRSRPGVLQRCGAVTCRPGTCDHRDEPTLQRSSSHRGSLKIPPTVNEVLRSPGQPLDATTRAFMEPRLGHSFAQVRVHTDAMAADSASAVHALAFTVGRDIVVGANQYRPASREGRRLLAHELVHVVQQGGPQGRTAAVSAVSEPGEPAEQEADAIARSLESGGEISRPTPRHGVLQRVSDVAPCPGHEPGEDQMSFSAAGHLPSDVIRLAPDRLLVADFGIGWRHVKPEVPMDPALRAWLQTFEADASYHLRIIGYSDCVGPDQTNIDLRQGRARNVESLLGPQARSRVAFRGMAALGEFVNDNSNITNRARNRGVVIEFQQDAKPPAPTTTTMTNCGPDSTQWLVDQMNKNKDHPVIRKFRETRWPRWIPFFNLGWTYGFLQDFRDLVKAGAPWDFKSNQQQWRAAAGRTCPSAACDRTVTLCGRCFNYDVPGNIHYGWIGRMANLRAWFLHNRAAAAQAGGVDPPHDIAAIDIGVDMADSGTTLCDAIGSLGNQLNLQGTSGCAICSDKH